MLFLLAVAAVTLMGLSPVRQAWLICLCVHADRSTPGRCNTPAMCSSRRLLARTWKSGGRKHAKN